MTGSHQENVCGNERCREAGCSCASAGENQEALRYGGVIGGRSLGPCAIRKEPCGLVSVLQDEKALEICYIIR